MSWNQPGFNPAYNPAYPVPPYPSNSHGPLPVIQPPYPGQYPPPLPGYGGFQEHVVYKIMCVADMSVLDVADHATHAGARIITWSDSNQQNQKFRANRVGGGFRVTPLLQGPNGFMALDHNREAGSLGLWDTNDGMNQQFIAQEVSPGSQTFRIKSLHNHFCLRNMGRGSHVILWPENHGDVLQQWRLVPTY